MLYKHDDKHYIHRTCISAEKQCVPLKICDKCTPTLNDCIMVLKKGRPAKDCESFVKCKGGDAVELLSKIRTAIKDNETFIISGITFSETNTRMDIKTFFEGISSLTDMETEYLTTFDINMFIDASVSKFFTDNTMMPRTVKNIYIIVSTAINKYRNNRPTPSSRVHTVPVTLTMRDVADAITDNTPYPKNHNILDLFPSHSAPSNGYVPSNDRTKMSQGPTMDRALSRDKRFLRAQKEGKIYE